MKSDLVDAQVPVPIPISIPFLPIFQTGTLLTPELNNGTERHPTYFAFPSPSSPKHSSRLHLRRAERCILESRSDEASGPAFICSGASWI